jgi:hypothetical protein
MSVGWVNNEGMPLDTTVNMRLLKSANWSTLVSTVSTCNGSDRRMSLTTTLTTPVVLENRGSGNKTMKDWPSKVLRIHMKNFMDG